ncbi:hypothetical protein CVT24_001427, partial [Panaeolus cyanescens]
MLYYIGVPRAIAHIHSHADDIDAYNNWWSDDNVAQYVITSKLSADIFNAVPPADETCGERRTARFIYSFLRSMYGSGDYSSASIEYEKARALRCKSASNVTNYISKWQSAVNLMRAAGHPPDLRQTLQFFAQGLPTFPTSFIILRDSVLMSLNGPDHAIRSFATLVQEPSSVAKFVLQSSDKLKNGKSGTTSSLSLPSNSASTSNTTTGRSRPRHVCGNCSKGHLTEHCYQPGGAMEGKQAEVEMLLKTARMSQKQSSTQANVAANIVSPAAHAATTPSSLSSTQKKATDSKTSSLNNPVIAN